MERFAAQHAEHSVVGAAALPVAGRCESVPVRLAIVHERVEDRRFRLIHDEVIPGPGSFNRVRASSTTFTMPSSFFWNVSYTPGAASSGRMLGTHRLTLA